MTKLVSPSYREVMQKLWECSPITSPEYYSTAGQVADQLMIFQGESYPSDEDRDLFESHIADKLDRLAEQGKIKRVWVFGKHGYRTLKSHDNRCKGAPFQSYWFGGL